jgi:hypothetical protein
MRWVFDHSILSAVGFRIRILAFFRIGSMTPFFCEDRKIICIFILKKALHCEKSLFVLAFRPKIPLLRIENPAVDTRMFFPPPTEFFIFPYTRKIFRSLEEDFLHVLVPEKSSRSLEQNLFRRRYVDTDTAGKSGHWRKKNL